MKAKTYKLPGSKLKKEIKEANKDSELVKGVEEFLVFHTGRKS